MTSVDVWERFSHLFLITCIIGAISLLTWCLSEYSKNEDVVEVSFKKYGEDEDSIYPDISLCFDHPFDEEKLKLFDDRLTKSLFTRFLSGKDFEGEWPNKLLDIDYENVSLQLKDHLIGNAILYPALGEYNITIYNFTVVNNPAFRCFTFHLPTQVRLLGFSVALSNSIFSSGKRPKSGFEVGLHYPQQLIRSWQFRIRNWPIRTNMSADSYQMDINVKDIEILRHRDKRKKPCSSSKSYDNDTFKEIIEAVGCIPPYFDMSLGNSFVPCKTKKDLLQAANMLGEATMGVGKFDHSSSPCSEVQRIGVIVEDTDFNVSKMISGEDLDINLSTPFILESWLKNGE